MVKPITTYIAQKRLSWYGHVMRREDTSVAKLVTTMKVGGKRPRGRPRPWGGWTVCETIWNNTSSIQSSHRTEKHGGEQSWLSTRTGIRSAKVRKDEHSWSSEYSVIANLHQGEVVPILLSFKVWRRKYTTVFFSCPLCQRNLAHDFVRIYIYERHCVTPMLLAISSSISTYPLLLTEVTDSLLF